MIILSLKEGPVYLNFVPSWERVIIADNKIRKDKANTEKVILSSFTPSRKTMKKLWHLKLGHYRYVTMRYVWHIFVKGPT